MCEHTLHVAEKVDDKLNQKRAVNSEWLVSVNLYMYTQQFSVKLLSSSLDLDCLKINELQNTECGIR